VNMIEKVWREWAAVVRIGLLGGVVALYLCLAGLVGVFSDRALITGLISLGHTLLVLAVLIAGYVGASRAPAGQGRPVLAGGLVGLISGATLALLVLIGNQVNLRAVLLNASPALYALLTLNQGVAGVWVPALLGTVLGGLGGLIYALPLRARQPVVWGLAALIGLGLFAGFLRTPMLTGSLSGLARFLFGPEGLTPAGALITLALVVVGSVLRDFAGPPARKRIAALPDPDRLRLRRLAISVGVLLGALVVLALPYALGPFVAQVVALVALYVLMGLGLNITLGFAGLLDLGFVAFFAVGAYTVGLLTSTAEYGLAQWPFWAAVPFAVLLAMAFGAFLGLPILGIRGDYLAIATLGFGEIIRILAGSDLMKPLLGGPRGILNIPKPIDGLLPDHPLAGPNQIYYLSLVCAMLIAFVAVRLRDSRLGRTWMAVREDEDVAEALGVNLVQTKLLAYMLGAAFAGLGGALFAALIGSIFASSMQLFVSFNVVSLLIVGGLGSIPGVVVGAIFLIGLPELFREFSEYRFLFYGAAMIAMMLRKPEGLLPSTTIRRELHAGEEEEALPADAAIGDAPSARSETAVTS
jgi:branched-chain amino acid transport system permease protein